MVRLIVPLRVLGVWLVIASLAVAQQAAAPAQKARARRGASPRTYMGRPIADVMSYQGADWLFRPEREQEERPDAMLDALGIQPGQTVADVGAGAGYISLRLARRVGPKGKVLATDLQTQMLQLLIANARAAGVKNIKPIRCTASDPKLPAGEVDLVLMVDVYHECSNPEATLKGVRRALKPGGRLVLVEFRGEDPDVPIKPEHKMTLTQVRKEIEPQGFVFQESQEFLPWQHIIIFERPADGPKPGAVPPAEPEKAGP
jgi:SAM-dependent methyltransferase